MNSLFTVRINNTNSFDPVKVKMLSQWVKLSGFKDNKPREKTVKNNRKLMDRHNNIPKEKQTRPTELYYITFTEKMMTCT